MKFKPTETAVEANPNIAKNAAAAIKVAGFAANNPIAKKATEEKRDIVAILDDALLSTPFVAFAAFVQL